MKWTLDLFASEAAQRGSVVGALVPKFLAWGTRRPGSMIVGEGKSGPLYFMPEAADSSRVRLCSVDLDGMVLILLNELRDKPPFDRVAERIEIQSRLSRVVGFEIQDAVVEAGTWQTVDGGYLLSPGSFEEFAATFDWVAAELAAGGSTT
jgi:hypothetical protein